MKERCIKVLIKCWEYLLKIIVFVIATISIGLIIFAIHLFTDPKQILAAAGILAAAATSLSVVYLAEQIRISAEQEKIKRSYDYLARYNSEDFKDTIADALEFIRDGGKTKDERWNILSNKKTRQHKKIRSVVTLYFNFFEDLAIFYNRELLDNDLIDSFFKSISLSTFNEGKDCIDKFRKDGQSTSYKEWGEMNEKIKNKKIRGEIN